MLLSMFPLLFVAVITGLFPKYSWLFILCGLFFQIVFVTGVSFVLSSCMVFFRDIQFLWGVFTTAWLYATPIMYPVDILPEFMQRLEMLNPMYYYITFMRSIVIDGVVPAPGIFLGCFLCALIALVVGCFVFKKTQDQFVLYI